MIISLYRYNPEKDKKPYMQEFEMPDDFGKDKMVLDALLFIKANQDESLTFRRSCREGVCGSDGLNINGKNQLACITPLASCSKRKITVRPLPGFPVIRDLVVDMTVFFKQYERMEPYLQNDTPAPPKERLQSPAERSKLDGLYECILCACCSASCPPFWWNPDKFVGPAGLLQAYRFVADSRDLAREKRLSKLGDRHSLFGCRGIMDCIDVCPKHLNPTHAIGELRENLVKGP